MKINGLEGITRQQIIDAFVVMLDKMEAGEEISQGDARIVISIALLFMTETA